MNVTTKLTLDGLVRALRGRMHKVADEVEAGYYSRQRKDTLKHSAQSGDDDDGIIRE